jgi:nucleoside 2-deoxyribosyltransferase
MLPSKVRSGTIKIMATHKPKVYLAGPAVFRPDAAAFGLALKELCRRNGLEGCFPLDNDVAGEPMPVKAAAIYRANVGLIESCSAVVADISPFRGPNMDPGTAWEIGYAIAKGRPVFAWTSEPALLFERTTRLCEGQGAASAEIDEQGWTIENFGLCENLMIALSASVYPSADDAVAACAVMLQTGG